MKIMRERGGGRERERGGGGGRERERLMIQDLVNQDQTREM